MAEYEDGRSTSSRGALLFVCCMNHIPPYLFRSREEANDVRHIGTHDLSSILLHPMLSNANPYKPEAL